MNLFNNLLLSQRSHTDSLNVSSSHSMQNCISGDQDEEPGWGDSSEENNYHTPIVKKMLRFYAEL